MKIAIVLYGQPRNYENGYKTIMKFVASQPDCHFVFFYHCWILNSGEYFTSARWRHIEKSSLKYDDSTPQRLCDLYHPVLYEYQYQTKSIIESSQYKNTIAFKQTYGEKALNADNVIFQMYSRNKSRNLLASHVSESGDVYDFVIATRFDIGMMPDVNLNDLDKTKTYVSNIHLPRKILPDNCIITPMATFIKWFTFYDDIPLFLNDTETQLAMQSIHEQFEINPEEMILAKYIYNFKNINTIGHFKGGTI
jgi:hypothetical protein